MSEKMGGKISPEKAEYKRNTIEKVINQIKGALGRLETANEQNSQTSLHLIHEILKKFKSIEFLDYDNADLLKIAFDDILIRLKKTLEVFEQSALNQVSDVVGHEVTRGFGIYYRQKESISNSEHEIHSRAKALECLTYLHYQAFDKVLDYYVSVDNTEMIEKVKKTMGQDYTKVYQPSIEAYMYQSENMNISDIEVEAVKDFLEKFPHPFLTREETKKILQELIGKLEAVL